MHIQRRHRRLWLTISFFLPVLLMGGYFAYRGMAPFGSSSILTVDLGQQYVDFFSYLRSTLLHHPTSIFYSFSKGLGGEMWGTNAYYLFSPLNLILLPFAGKFLSTGILILVLIKYGLAGLSMAWLLDKTTEQHGGRLLAFSTPYSMMGWMIANQLNVLWLDVLWLLPLVIYGLMVILDGRGWRFYLTALAVTMIDNYYMAWMVALFTLLFASWYLTTTKEPWRPRVTAFSRYLLASIGAATLAAVVLLPTVFALTKSKGTYTSTSVSFKWEYNPFKILAKFVPGSFNFDQMPSGQPNIYVGMLMVAGFLAYLLSRRDRWPARLSALLVTAFLVVSFVWSPLDLLWHLGQYPVWYPSRFSFVFCFWLIWLAARTLEPGTTFSWPVVFGVALIFLVGALPLFFNWGGSVNYISQNQLWIGAGFAAIAVVILTLRRQTSPALTDALIVLLAVCDVSTSAYTALNNISYVSQAEFGNYTSKLDAAVNTIKKGDQGLYRIAKDFMRTKDDPFQADYNAADHFSSTMEPSVSSFVGSIGQPAGDGFITYTNGTELTDSLLGFKYSMTANNGGKQAGTQVLPLTSARYDWDRQTTLSSSKLITIKKNPTALSLAFGASDQILSLSKNTLDPLNYQSQIYQALAGKSTNNSLFKVQNFDHVTFINLHETTQITGAVLTKVDSAAPAAIRLTFKPTTNDPYYLTLGSGILDNVTITRNGKALNQYDTYRDTVVVSVADHAKGKSVTITMTLKKNSAWLQNVSLYRLNQASFMADYQKLAQSPLKITHYSSTKVSGTVKLKPGATTLMTTIPAAVGWHALVDGHPSKLHKVLNTFWALKLTPGTHQVTFYFVPPLLIWGLLISLGAFAAFFALPWWRKVKTSRRS